MTFRFRKLQSLSLAASLLAVILASAAASFAGTVTGTVRNGTTNKPAPNVEMILIQLQGGMQPVANTKTDADGHFKFDNPMLGTAPMLDRPVCEAGYVVTNGPTPITVGLGPGTSRCDVLPKPGLRLAACG